MLSRSPGIIAAFTLTLATAHAADIRGTVVDSEGKAIPGAKIYGLSKEKVPVITNAIGAFSVNAKEAGAPNVYFALVVAPGYVPRILERVTRKELTKIVLDRGVSESGTVVSPMDRPLAGVHVTVTYMPDPATHDLLRERLGGQALVYYNEATYSTVTDVAGKWTIVGIPPKVDTIAGIIEPKYFVGSVSRGTNKKLVAQRAGIVTGRLLGPDGKPRANARVWLTPLTPEPGVWQRSTKTDAEGTFTFGALPEATWTVTVAPLEGDALVETQYVATLVGKIAATGDLNLVRGVLVKGRVIDKDTGRGVPNALISTLCRHNLTDSWNAGIGPLADRHGWWSMRLLPGGVKIAARSAHGRFRGMPNTFIKIIVSETEGQQAPPIELKRTPYIVAKVVNEAGKPLKGVPFRILILGHAQTIPMLKTDRSGLWNSEADPQCYLAERMELAVHTSPEWEVVSPTRIMLPVKSLPVVVVLRPKRPLPEPPATPVPGTPPLKQ